MNQSVLDTLKGVRELLSDPTRWTVGTSARDEDGYSTGILDEEACRWCLMGAVIKAAAGNSEKIIQAFNALRAELPVEFTGVYGELSSFNDAVFVRHEDVLQLIDRTISRVSGTGA